MKRLVLSLTTLLAIAVPSIALACAEHAAQNTEAKKAEPKKITVAELSTLREAKQARPVDVNGAETRAKFGVIPGAVLLTSASAFDPAKELPAAKGSKLVFYCANTQCTASQTAAVRALEAGYTDVSVLPDGIKGWKEAGKKTELPRS